MTPKRRVINLSWFFRYVYCTEKADVPTFPTFLQDDLVFIGRMPKEHSSVLLSLMFGVWIKYSREEAPIKCG